MKWIFCSLGFSCSLECDSHSIQRLTLLPESRPVLRCHNDFQHAISHESIAPFDHSYILMLINRKSSCNSTNLRYMSDLVSNPNLKFLDTLPKVSHYSTSRLRLRAGSDVLIYSLSHSTKPSRLKIIIPPITSHSRKHKQTLGRIILLLHIHQTLIRISVKIMLELRVIRIRLVEISA